MKTHVLHSNISAILLFTEQYNVAQLVHCNVICKLLADAGVRRSIADQSISMEQGAYQQLFLRLDLGRYNLDFPLNFFLAAYYSSTRCA